MSSNQALGTTKDAYGKDTTTSDADLGAYRGTQNQVLSNVNSAIAAGNPFKSRDYLTDQNLMTSGAMNSANDAAQNQLQQTAERTGTNTAAIAGQVAENARGARRDLTAYNAQRDTDNTSRWLQERDALFGQQQTAANSQANVYGITKGAATNALGDYTSAANADQQSKLGIINGVVQAGGTAAGGWLGRTKK